MARPKIIRTNELMLLCRKLYPLIPPRTYPWSYYYIMRLNRIKWVHIGSSIGTFCVHEYITLLIYYLKHEKWQNESAQQFIADLKQLRLPGLVVRDKDRLPQRINKLKVHGRFRAKRKAILTDPNYDPSYDDVGTGDDFFR